ncbi:hypothetical protein LJ760_12595, partial [Arthrobacter sp. zg-Y895]|nr:hypothetical protein [Arthrobacter sp. zg-Y895]
MSPWISRTLSVTAITGFLLMMLSDHAIGVGGGNGKIEGSGTVVGSVFRQDPSSGMWTQMPVGIPDDPEGYRFEPVCFDDLAGNVDCLASNQAACTAGEDGRLVFWYSGLKTRDPSLWEKVSETPSCIYSEEPVDVGEQIQAQILTAFQERPIAAGKLVLQPSPHTLVGMETNVYVEA